MCRHLPRRYYAEHLRGRRSSRFDAITKEISPLTAYCLGLTDTCPELAQFPLLADMTPGVFSYGADGETGSAEAGENWPGAVAV